MNEIKRVPLAQVYSLNSVFTACVKGTDPKTPWETLVGALCA